MNRNILSFKIFINIFHKINRSPIYYYYYYEDVTFSTLTPDKIPDPKKINKKNTVVILYLRIWLIYIYIYFISSEKKIIPFFTKGRNYRKYLILYGTLIRTFFKLFIFP